MGRAGFVSTGSKLTDGKPAQAMVTCHPNGTLEIFEMALPKCINCRGNLKAGRRSGGDGVARHQEMQWALAAGGTIG